ncbi:MAG: protein-export chaperone SecB [Moraxellaceae bacterium]|nr:protein-export chaperone SecB [Moraxellaceae bacterium]
MADEQQQPLFNIEKIYVKDLSVEVPNAPAIYLDRTQPEVNVELSTAANAIENGFFEVTLKSTVTAKAGETTMFLVEVAQAGIFQLRNIPEAEIEPVLMIGCANILFPYAREAISDAVTRAGFQPVLLNPVNFEGMYHARLQQQQQAEASPIIQ